MADARSWTRLRRRAAVALLAALVLATLLTGGARAATGSVQGWLGNGTSWPQRSLVVFAPAGAKVSPSTLKVTENGARTPPLSVTALRQAGPEDFGLMVVMARGSSMTGAPLNGAVAATRGLAASRSPGQQLGVVAFGARPSVTVPISHDEAAIARGLARTPSPSAGTTADVPAAIGLGLAQLAQAHVALGAIIVVSDGVGKLTQAGGTTPASVRDAAAAANVPIFTVGVQDRAATAASLGSLRSVASGQLVQAPPARLSSVFKEIEATVTRGYVARWRSSTRSGASVDVQASLAGRTGSIHAAYAIPAPRRRAGAAASTRPLGKGGFSLAPRLSALPSFAVAPVARPIAPSAPAPASPTGSFWNSPQGVLAVAAIVAALITLMIMLLFHRPARRAVRTRVNSYLPGPELEQKDTLALEARRAKDSLLGRFEHGRWWPPFVEDVEISGLEPTPVGLVKRAAIVGLVVGLLVGLISGSPPLGFLPILGWPWALRKFVGRKAAKMRDKFREALPSYLQDLASAMRVGRSFVGALTAVAESGDEPLKSAFERALTDEAFGRPLEEALDAVATRMQATDLGQVALIAGLNRRSGSNVSEALDRVAEGARERADLRREIKALTAQAKMSSIVLTALPGVLLVGINLVSPLYAHPLFHTTIGIVLLGVGSMMVFMGWKALQKITRVEA